MEFEEAKQIATAILYAEAPMVQDQYGTCRRLAGVISILSSHTQDGTLSITEDGRTATLHCNPIAEAERGEAGNGK